MPSRGKQQLGATVQVATSAANAARASLMPCSALKHDAVPHHSVQAMVRHGVAWEEWPAPAAAAYVRKSVQVSPPLLSQFWSMPRTRQARDRSAFLAAAPLLALASVAACQGCHSFTTYQDSLLKSWILVMRCACWALAGRCVHISHSPRRYTLQLLISRTRGGAFTKTRALLGSG